MAGIDYIKCAECGERLIYDGDDLVTNKIVNRGTTVGLTCDKCVAKLKKKIAVLKKHDRRRH